MSTVETRTRYTPADLLKMPDGDHYELVDGQLVETDMSALSSFVAGQIYLTLGNHCRASRVGWPHPEGTSYQCFPDAPEKVRKPDVSFIRLERWSLEEASHEGHIPIAPDLAVEVLSPNDLAYEVDRKIRDYFAAGVRMIWVVNPETRTVAIYRDGRLIGQCQEQDEISGEDVIPGFRCKVANFFWSAKTSPVERQAGGR